MASIARAVISRREPEFSCPISRHIRGIGKIDIEMYPILDAVRTMASLRRRLGSKTLPDDFWVHNLVMARTVSTNSKLGFEPFMVVKGRKLLHYSSVYKKDIDHFQRLGSHHNRIHNLSKHHEAILRDIRTTVKRLDGGLLGTHKIATWIPILGPFSIYLHIYFQIIRKIPQLNLPRSEVSKAIGTYALTIVAAFLPALGYFVILFGSPSSRVLHQIESYLSLRCAIEWHEKHYPGRFERKLASVMDPNPNGPSDRFRDQALTVIDRIKHNGQPILDKGGKSSKA